MKKTSAFLEQSAFVFSLILLATFVGGTKECQEDYSLGSQTSITPSATPTETPDADETVSGTATPNATATAAATLSATAIATATTAPTVSTGAQILRSLSTLDSDSGEKKAAAASAASSASASGASENWLGHAFKKDSAASASVIDTDGDGYTDDYEIEFGSDPDNRAETPPPPVTKLSQRMRGNDSDMDGVSDLDEARLGLNPGLRDSDGDGCPDGAEILSGSDAKSAANRPTDDKDGDCLSASYEDSIRTDSGKPDSDGDGLRDDFELAIGSSPLDADSDRDGILDGKEFGVGSDPARADPHP
jgi:hypothetical protein